MTRDMPHSHCRGGDRTFTGTIGTTEQVEVNQRRNSRASSSREDPREHCWSVHNRFGDLVSSYKRFVLTTRLKSEPTFSSRPSFARPTLVEFVGSFDNELSMERIVLYSVAFGLHADERYDSSRQSNLLRVHSPRVSPLPNGSRTATSFAPPLNILQRRWLGCLDMGNGWSSRISCITLVRLIFTTSPEFFVASVIQAGS